MVWPAASMLLRLVISQFASSPSSIAYSFKPLLELEKGVEIRSTNPCQRLYSIWAAQLDEWDTPQACSLYKDHWYRFLAFQRTSPVRFLCHQCQLKWQAMSVNGCWAHENAIEVPDLRKDSSSQSLLTPIVSLVNDFLQRGHAPMKPFCANPVPSGLHHEMLIRGGSRHLGHAIETVSDGVILMG